MIDKISKDQEKKLVDSVVSAIEMANGGTHPNEAIAKVASDQGFNQDFIRRMCEAFNVSKSLKHLKSAKGDDRAAEFDIADPGVILKELYPDTVPDPFEKKEAEWEPSGVDMTGERFFDISSTPVLSKKKAESTHNGPTVDQLVNRAYRECNRLERAAGLAKDAMAQTKQALVDSIDEFASYFRQLDHEPFDRVEKAALYHWGEEVRPLMSAVYDMSKRASFGEKRAEAGEPVKYRDRRPYELLSEVVDTRDNYVDCVVKYSAAQREFNDYKDKLDRRCRIIVKLAETGGLDLSIPGVLSPFKSLLELPAPELSPTLVEETKAELLSPEYMAERRSIGTQMTLQDIMKNDPVISAADPESVIEAYNELSTTAPNVLSSPLALKAYLRKSLEAETLDPIEIAALLKMDRQVRSEDKQGE